MVNNVRESKPCGCVTSHRAWSSLPDRRNKQTLLTRGHWMRAHYYAGDGIFYGDISFQPRRHAIRVTDPWRGVWANC